MPFCLQHRPIREATETFSFSKYSSLNSEDYGCSPKSLRDRIRKKIINTSLIYWSPPIKSLFLFLDQAIYSRIPGLILGNCGEKQKQKK